MDDIPENRLNSAAGSVVPPDGAEWLRDWVWSLFSDEPAMFGDVLRRRAVLVAGDFVACVVRATLPPGKDKSSLCFRVFVIFHIYQGLLGDLFGHGYDVQGPGQCPGSELRLRRGDIFLDVFKVSVDPESGFICQKDVKAEKEAIAFVHGVYKLEEAFVSRGQAVHLMSDFATVCLPCGLEPGNIGAGLLPVVGAGDCCTGQSPRVFPLFQASRVLTEDEMKLDQEERHREGRQLGPAPAELDLLRCSLVSIVFSSSEWIRKQEESS